MRFIVKVTSPFSDKYTGQPYTPGETIALNDEARVKDMARQNLAVLLSAKPKTTTKKHGKRVMVFHDLLYVIGGIETALYNLAKAYKDHNIKFVFKSMDSEQALRLAEYCEVELDDPSKKYETDVLILASYNCYPIIKGRVKADKIYQQVHADWAALKKMPLWNGYEWPVDKDVDRVLAVSDTAAKGLRTAFKKPIDSVVAPNILCPPEKQEFKVFLTLSRLTAEKGADLIVKMVQKFHEAGKSFLWIISATHLSLSKIDKALAKDKSVIFIEPSVDNLGLLSKVDYLVQLSQNESYCYSVHEALQVGTPVIGTNIPEIAKAVKQGENGYLVGQNLDGLDIEAIFNKKPEFAPISEKIDPVWEKVLEGKL